MKKGQEPAFPRSHHVLENQAQIAQGADELIKQEDEKE